MAYYKVCEKCGSNLDPDEKCDCNKEKEDMQVMFSKYLKRIGSGQLEFVFCGEEGNE